MSAATGTSLDYKALAAKYGQKYGILLALILVCVILTFANEYFLTTRNILNVLRQTSINGILAIGMTFVILTRGIDLSVGSVVALAGIVSASMATTSQAAAFMGAPYPAVIAFAVGIGVGLLAGWINGIVVARFNVPAFVTTLGMLVGGARSHPALCGWAAGSGSDRGLSLHRSR